MIQRFMLPVFTCFITTTCFCQTLKYDVMLLGKKIGEAKVEKKDSGNFIQYKLASNSDAKILGMDKKNTMATQAVFDKQGTMVASDFADQKNKEKLSTKVVAEKDKLSIDKDGKKYSLPEPATFTSLSLYFTEPKDHQKIFSERLGQFVEIAKEKEGKYKIAFDDYTAVYTYVEGKITELQMKERAGQVVMKLVE